MEERKEKAEGEILVRWGRRWARISPEFQYIMHFLRALAGPRWLILRIIGDKEKSTSEIYQELVTRYGAPIPRSLLYYHLSELERLGVIEMVGYRETGKGGAPEKVWKLKVRKIVIDILSGQITTEL